MAEIEAKLILIVDDADDNRLLLTTLFEARGCQVCGAANGEEAMALLRELARLPDLIFLDAQMPVMDGFQFRAEQMKHAEWREIPVIVMTGDDDLEMGQKMIDPACILIKPLRLRTVVDSVQSFLE